MSEEQFVQPPSTRFFGKSLDEAIEVVHPERKPLIENFLYEKSALMLYADDGIGKSVLSLQACLQATVAGSKVFGEFEVPKARNVLYFQMERHPDEPMERMRHMREVIPFDTSKFCLSVDLQGIDLQQKGEQERCKGKLLDIVADIGFIPEIVAFDPIYPLAGSGLEKAEACNAINSFFRVVQLYLNCTIIATSHTNRGVRDNENPGHRVGKDMYGNRFLSSFFTSSYHIEALKDGSGSKWTRDKNSYKNLEKEIQLTYDPSTYCSWYSDTGQLSKKDRLDMFIKAQKSNGKEFDFAQMQAASLLSDSQLRGYLTGYLKDKIEISSKGLKGKNFYKSL